MDFHLLTHRELIQVYYFYYKDLKYQSLTLSQLIEYLSVNIKINDIVSLSAPVLSFVSIIIPNEIKDLLIAKYYYINRENILNLEDYQNIDKRYYIKNNQLFYVYINVNIKLDIPSTYNTYNLKRLIRICRIISRLILNKIQSQILLDNKNLKIIEQNNLKIHNEQGQIYLNNLNKSKINLYEYLYKKLVITYDTRILNDYDNKVKEDMLGYVFSKNNMLLFNLIYNLINYNIKYDKYLSGVKSIVKLVNEDKTIYLIGHYPNTRHLCDNVNYVCIEDLLQEIILNSPVFLDIFIEYDIVSTNTKLSNNNSSFIINKFSNDNDNVNVWKNMNIHRIDPRYIPRNKKSSLMLFFDLIYNIWINDINPKMIDEINKYEDILNEFYKCESIVDIFNILKLDLHNNVYIKNIIDGSLLKNKEKLIDFIILKVVKHIDTYTIPKNSLVLLKDWIISLKKSNINVIIETYQFAEYLLLVYSSLIDIYTIFKIFDVNSNNMMVICGESHKKILCDVLTETMDFKIYNHITSSNNFLKINNIFNL